MPSVELLQAYVERHFIRLPELAARGGVELGRVQALIAAGALPGPSYRIWRNGAFWSAVGGAHNGDPEGRPVEWYSPAAAWWIRRASGLDLLPEAIAGQFAKHFATAFVTELADLADARLAYPDACPGGTFSPEAAARVATAEWADWINGGYGVCLRHWSAADVIAKMLHRGRIIALTAGGTRETLAAAERAALLDAVERLEAVMLPFAPHQRPTGTPGLWIDRMLLRYGLGEPAEPGAAEATTDLRLCA